MRIDVYEKSKKDYSNIIISSKGTSIELTDSNAKSWYICSDIECSNPILCGTGNTYIVPEFQNPEIRYYKCEGTNYSKVYYVVYTGLPTVYIDTENNQEILSKEYIQATIQIVDNEKKPDKEKSLEETSVLIKGRGNTSWLNYPKKGFGLKFDNKTEILGMAKGKKWALISNYTNGSKMGNWYASHLARKVINYSEWTSENKFVDLYLNGEYYGCFSFAELIKIDKQRLNIQDISDISTSNDKIKDVNKDGKINLYDGGFVIEVSKSRDSTVQFSTSRGVPIALKDPDLEEAESDYSFREAYYHIKRIIQNAENAIYNNSSLEYQNLFDINSFIDWYIVNEAVGNEESAFQSSVYMYYNPSDGKIHMSTLWDFDRTLNSSNGAKCNRTNSLWVKQLLSRPEVKEKLQERWNNKKSAFTNSINSKLKDKAEECSIALQLDQIRWPNTSKTDINETLEIVKSRFDWFSDYVSEL